MPPKTKKQQAAQDESEKDAIRPGPTVHWLVRDPATNPLVPCPTSGRCYAHAALIDNSKLYIFGGWNGMTRTEALAKLKKANLPTTNVNLLNISAPAAAGGASATGPTAGAVHVPAPPSSAPAGGKKKHLAGNQSVLSATNVSKDLNATVGPGNISGASIVNNFFADGSLAPSAAAAAAKNAFTKFQDIPHPCHEREILCYDIVTSVWSVHDSVLGEPHPGTSQFSFTELSPGQVLLFGGWDGYKRHNALTHFSQSTQHLRDTPSSFPTGGGGGGGAGNSSSSLAAKLLKDGARTMDGWRPYTEPNRQPDTPPPPPPPPLCFHAMAGYGKKLFVFGGETQEGLNGDMYVCDLTTSVWTPSPVVGIPSKRTSHTMTILQGLYLVIYGGRNADGVALNDVSIFDISNNQWVTGIKSAGVGPARFGHTAVAITDKSILIYGGCGPRIAGTGPNANGAYGAGGGGAAGGSVGTAASMPPAGASAAGGGSGKDKGSDKEKEAALNAQLVNAIGSYELHSDVWVLTLGDKLGTISWERCQIATSTDPIAPRAMSPSRSLGSLGGDASAAGTPVPPDAHVNGGANNNNNNNPTNPTPLPANSIAGSRANTPSLSYGLYGAPQTSSAAPPPAPRAGHTAVLFGSQVYVYGGRTDSVGGVSKEIAVLDISALLPPPPPPTEGRDTRMDTDSAMRAPSSTLTQ